MKTIGLDFGTHQTKVCLCDQQGVAKSYTFLQFPNAEGEESLVLPSLVEIDNNGRLHYGYVSNQCKGEAHFYFKGKSIGQEVVWSTPVQDEVYYTIWYIAYILFNLEDLYQQDFSIQMGAPMDSEHIEKVQQQATRILLSAYRLVEKVFKNDKKKFLDTPIKELKSLTEIVPFSKEQKNEYAILVFPEAYANLLPLLNQGKIEKGGINMLVDIGGGTTDVSFFNTLTRAKDQHSDLVVFHYCSIAKGLNYLTHKEDMQMLQIEPKKRKNRDLSDLLKSMIEGPTYENVQPDLNVSDSTEIDKQRKSIWRMELEDLVHGVIQEMFYHCPDRSDFTRASFEEALRDRLLQYAGGGSAFSPLCTALGRKNDYHVFSKVRTTKKTNLDLSKITNDARLVEKFLPVLSTAFGLAEPQKGDSVTVSSIKALFPEPPEPSWRNYSSTDDIDDAVKAPPRWV